ncbi:hypothetical protein H0B56_03325 [Haloechinothrix sp. YIM 98757]|uniref:DUF6571 domain-containing protein n=1 Tax=Haloechinothrix aidingensis TaxID=2752311 RepID=A0A837ZVA6_9PSEU|nr:DUF6571 family protein [Haloechinothrix aidingensis]MBA0124566.1 hypothetical protein [Haloechinothrix aidingensis]
MTYFEQFYNADTGEFHDAARACGRAAEAVRDRADDFRNKVVEHLSDTSESGVWSGKPADAAQDPMLDVLAALNRAADQLEEVPGLLEGYADDAQSLQSRLHEIVKSAEARGIEVDTTNGSVHVPAEVAEKLAAEGEQDPALAVSQDISRVINEKNDLDRRVAPQVREALNMELNAHTVGDDYRSDANRAAELVEELSEGSLAGTDEERAELLALLAEHGDDPKFAGQVFDELGGRGSVEALSVMARLGSAAAMHGEDAAELSRQTGELQAQFGRALATATDPDSPYAVDVSEGSEWMQEFTAAGETKMDIGLPSYEPYGYQLIGTALRSGDYSSEFLNTLGTEMLEFERGDPNDSDDSGNPDAFRMNVPTDPMHEGFQLNHIDDSGAGFDPFDGLMIAMEGNPEAGREFFDPAAHDGRIEYMLDRGDWNDLPALHNPGADYDNPSQSYVLDTLASATDGAERGSVGNDIAVETIKHVGSTDGEAVGLVNDTARESMGQLLEGQLDHINEAYGPGTSRFEDEVGVTLNRVLGDVAYSPEAYGNLSNAQNAYTALHMNEAAAAGNEAVLKEHAASMGNVMAQLDQGKAAAIEDKWSGEEDDYNSRVDAVGRVGGYAIGVATESVPVVGDVTSDVLDDIVERSKVDYSDHAEGEVARLNYDSSKEISRMTEQIIWENGLYETSKDVPANLMQGGDSDGKPIPLSDMTDAQRDSYDKWKSENEKYSETAGEALADVNNSYKTGSVSAGQSQGDS